MEDLELEKAILDFVGRPGYKPMKPRMIAQRLQFFKDQNPKEAATEVRRAVKRLIRRGQVAYAAGHQVRPVAVADQRSSRVVGVFHRTQKGFGFVRPTDVPPGTEVQDIYIPAERAGDAATGDVVLVQVRRPRDHEPGPRGEILEILERETNQFVGTYFESGGAAYVQVDGTIFTRPIYVGDPGAKNARPDDKVVFEMVRFPSPVHDGEGVITEVLGPRGKPGVDTLSIIREFALPDHFAEDALAEARAEAETFDETKLGDRLDLSAETIVTIDPVDARDFDDAISLTPMENGHWRLGVHIADVAHFVRPRTALDREAQDRATSVYLPDRVIPMLPEVISNSLASLQPGKVRYTKSAIMEFTAEGLRVSTELHSSAIKSSKRLTYEQVDEFLKDPEPWRRKLGVKVHELLGRMHTLAMILRRRRLEHGALELTMPEVKVDLDPSGRVSGAHIVENTESHQIIEEFMLAANEAVAETLHDKALHFLRRIHQPPSPQKIKALSEFMAELGLKVDGLQSRFEQQKLLHSVAGTLKQYAVNFAVLRSMKRAAYGPQEEGHYALASDCYCHFTSPIRRYPDVTIHRLVDALLTHRKPRNDYDELVVQGRHCSDRERRAETAERELTKLKLLSYLSDRIGEEMDALVTGVESFGLFVQGVKLPAEGLIRADTLTDDFYCFDRATHSLTGRRAGNVYRLGDLLRVAVARVDPERRELDFRLVERKPSPSVDGAKLAKRKARPTPAAKKEPARGGRKRKATRKRPGR
jgi:ribonuclease R